MGIYRIDSLTCGNACSWPCLSFLLFHQFILRVEAIRLYRQMLREIRRIESVPSREQLKRWIREEFESARHLKDEVRWLSSQGLVHQCVSVLSLVITSCVFALCL